jgi:hypothetical protein
MLITTKMTSEEDKKRERKEKLRLEAEKLGMSYKDLKEQKKAEKERKKRIREADALVNPEHKDDMKRMRNWSHDDKDPEAEQQGRETKRRRTRSMDAKEEEKNKAGVDTSSSLTPEEWRKEHNITVRGHGKYHGEGASAFPAPFLKFTDAPFNSTVLRSFEQAGFTAPTPIQSQVRIELVKYKQLHDGYL